MTSPPPRAELPIDRPDNVTVTTVLTAIGKPVMVTTMAVAVGAALVAVTDVPLIAAVGVADVAIKPLG